MSFASQQNNNAAQSEGRRIYIGNLNYELQASDIEGMLQQSGFPNFEAVKIPVDPGSQRNRGYCFVDFTSPEEAQRSLSELQGVVGGREIKVRPCEPKQQGGAGGFGGGGGGFNGGGYQQNAGGYNSGYQQNAGGYNSGYQQSSGGGFNGGYQNNSFGGQQQQRWGAGGGSAGGYQDSRDIRKLYVGGLGPQPEQELNEQEIMQIFQGFTPSSISKRLESTRANADGQQNNYHFSFVEFETPEEANVAKDAIDGRMYGAEGNQLRVSFAKPSRSAGQGGQQQQRWPRQQQQQQQQAGGGFQQQSNWR